MHNFGLKIPATALFIGLFTLSSPLYSADLEAIPNRIVIEPTDRIGIYFSNSDTQNPPRGMSYEIDQGWDVFMDKWMSKALEAGFKQIFMYVPFGQRSYIRDSEGNVVPVPNEDNDIMQFTMYQDCKRELPIVTDTFVPAWKQFFADHPDVKVTFGIGSLRTDNDVAAYLFGVEPEEIDPDTLKKTIWDKDCYDMHSYASHPDKLNTIWPDLIWPNIVPILEAGGRRLMFDSGSEYCGELGYTYLASEKLRKPELRDPVWDKMLIDALGNDTVEIFIETRPDKGPNKHFKGYSTLILDDYYEQSQPDLNPVFEEKSLRNADLHNIFRMVREQASYPADFLNVKKGILEGHTSLVYPFWILHPNDGKDRDHGNKYDISTLAEMFQVLNIRILPTNIKLKANGADENTQFIITRHPSYGTLSVDPKDSSYVTYTPNIGSAQPDSFEFKARSDDGIESDGALVQINPGHTTLPIVPVVPETGEQNNQIKLIRNVIGPDYGRTIEIKLIMQRSEKVRLDILNREGNKIINLADRDFSIGEHSIFWDGVNKSGFPVSSGIYLLKAILGQIERTYKTVIIR